MAEPRTLDERLRLIEAHIVVQEDILSAMQAERIEAERLNDSVVRLGDGATSLGEALLQVDRNQQMLTRLGRQLNDVEAASATKAEVERKVSDAKKELHSYRKQIVGRAYAASIGVLALLGGIGLLSANYVAKEHREDQLNCRERRATTAAVVGYLDVVQRNSLVPEIRESAKAVVDALPDPNQMGTCP